MLFFSRKKRIQCRKRADKIWYYCQTRKKRMLICGRSHDLDGVYFVCVRACVYTCVVSMQPWTWIGRTIPSSQSHLYWDWKRDAVSLVNAWEFISLFSALYRQTGMAASETASHTNTVKTCQNFTQYSELHQCLWFPRSKKTPLFLEGSVGSNCVGKWQIMLQSQLWHHSRLCGLYTLCLLNALKGDYSSVVPPTGWVGNGYCVGNSTASEKLRASHTHTRTQWCMWTNSTLQCCCYTV